jgi:hypothetical protein
MHPPVYLKQSDDEALPEDPVSYLVSGDGLFKNRSTGFFSCSVPCRRAAELAPHEPIVHWKRPIPQAMAEEIVGFFSALETRESGTEAVVLLAWGEHCGYRAIVPEQTATIAFDAFGLSFPVGVHYEVSPVLPKGMVLAGDVHSHGFQAAFQSETDIRDYRPGLQLVVGQVHLPDPPHLYATVNADGWRFIMRNPLTLFAGYARRSMDFPADWLSRVHIRKVPASRYPLRRPALEFPKKGQPK